MTPAMTPAEEIPLGASASFTHGQLVGESGHSFMEPDLSVVEEELHHALHKEVMEGNGNGIDMQSDNSSLFLTQQDFDSFGLSS